MPSPEVEWLIHAAVLRSVGFAELGAIREQTAGALGGDVSVTPQYALTVDAPQPGHPEFALTVRLTITLPPGRATVAVLGTYVLPADAPHLTPVVLTEYANLAGVPALVPFIREALADLTRRVFGAPILMPVLRPGELTFPLPQD